MNPAPPVTSRWPRDRRVPTVSAQRPAGRRGEATGGVVGGRHLGSAEQRRDGARVGPDALVDAGEETPVRDVVIEDVRDLELAATGWREPFDDVERVGPEEVDPDRDQVALWVLRFLLEPDDPAVRVEFGDTEALGIGNPVEHRARAKRPSL